MTVCALHAVPGLQGSCIMPSMMLQSDAGTMIDWHNHQHTTVLLGCEQTEKCGHQRPSLLIRQGGAVHSRGSQAGMRAQHGS